MDLTQKPLESAVCARCGAAIDPADHYLVSDNCDRFGAALCRSEHIVAWLLRGGQWQLDRPWEFSAEERTAQPPLKVLRVRSNKRIVRTFDSTEELKAWAAGGALWGESRDAC